MTSWSQHYWHLTDSETIADTRQRMAMFLAQIAHESGELRYVREGDKPDCLKSIHIC